MSLASRFLRLGIMNELQYRVNFFVQLVQSLLTLATSLVVLAIVFDRTDTLGGWTKPELLAVMGIFTLVTGVIRAFIQPNMTRLIGEIRDGKLDHLLTKPADAQTLVSVRQVEIWQVIDVALGAALIIVAAVRLDRPVSLGSTFGFVAMLLIGLVIIYCFWLMLATCAFWLVRMHEVEELFGGLLRAGQYPVGIYPGWMRAGLTFLVPLAFAVSVPAEALTGRMTTGTAVVAGVMAVGLVGLSRWFFRRGLRRYGSASS
jgi:ABC-2 type transport system permease protein